MTDRYAWSLSADGCELTIYEFEPTTRRLVKAMPLRRRKPMTEAEALKFVNDNYPRSGAVRAAADTLGLLRGKS